MQNTTRAAVAFTVLVAAVVAAKVTAPAQFDTWWRQATQAGAAVGQAAEKAVGAQPAGKVYRTQDAQGRTVYSDTPPSPQAKEAVLPQVNVVEAPKVPAAASGSINPIQAMREDNERFARDAQAAKDRRMDRLIETGSTEQPKR